MPAATCGSPTTTMSAIDRRAQREREQAAAHQPAQPIAASVSRATAASSHGSAWSRVQDRRLVALAGEEHDVAGPRPLERGLDRRPAVRDREDVHAPVAARALRAAHDLVDDRVAVLAARILVGRHDEPAPLARDPAHLAALRGVALAARAEHGDQRATPGRGDRREQVEDAGERRRRVGVVDDHRERLALVDPLHPARDALHGLEPGPDGGRVQAEAVAQGDDRERVVDVEPAGEPELDRGLAGRRARSRREAGGRPPRCASARTSAAASWP